MLFLALETNGDLVVATDATVSINNSSDIIADSPAALPEGQDKRPSSVDPSDEPTIKKSKPEDIDT